MKKSPTEKQIKARSRNWHIKQLRAFYYLIPPPVSKRSRLKIQSIVDHELEFLGAESETKRSEERYKKMEERMR